MASRGCGLWCGVHVTSLDKPETGRIAVKVINDNGDEVMTVFEV